MQLLKLYTYCNSVPRSCKGVWRKSSQFLHSKLNLTGSPQPSIHTNDIWNSHWPDLKLPLTHIINIGFLINIMLLSNKFPFRKFTGKLYEESLCGDPYDPHLLVAIPLPNWLPFTGYPACDLLLNNRRCSNAAHVIYVMTCRWLHHVSRNLHFSESLFLALRKQVTILGRLPWQETDGGHWSADSKELRPSVQESAGNWVLPTIAWAQRSKSFPSQAEKRLQPWLTHGQQLCE